MAKYLVTLSIGPVQSLIGAARRTRDLWCGSWLLHEAAKAAAKVLDVAQPGCLIFPDPETDLTESGKPKDDDANIANILRAEIDLPDNDAVRSLIVAAKQAAKDRLAQLCDTAKDKLNGLPFHDDLWQAQTDDILEAFGAWVKVSDGDTAYQEASTRLGSLLAARKATRDFLPAATTADGPGFGIPKSSLDGARESVINLSHEDRKAGKYKIALRKLGLSGMEELDALGIAKRMAGDVDQFTAYSRIAADAWVESLNDEQRQRVAAAYEPLVAPGLATHVKGNAGIYAKLPYDAQLVFGFRLDNALAAKDLDDNDKEKLKALQAVLRSIDTQPVPYAVILKADGDRMGELLSKATSADESRAISKALHGFAQSVRGIVRNHRGHAIYAGGDDVLAMLPLQNAVACANELADTFRQAMNGVAAQRGLPESERPTLSVGLGIGHLVEPLGRLRSRADEAESLAKGNGEERPRNALAIQLGIRSGAEMTWRCRWDDQESLCTMLDFIGAYRNEKSEYYPCPSRLGYDLRGIALRLDWAKEKDVALPGIHAAELARTLDRARQRGGDGVLRRELKELVTRRAESVGLARLADELIIARWLAARTQADIGALE